MSKKPSELLLDTKNSIQKIMEKIDYFSKQGLLPPKISFKTKKNLEEALKYIDMSLEEMKYGNVLLAEKLLKASRSILREITKLVQRPRELAHRTSLLRSYASAAYYDFSGKITIVRKAYKKYILAFVLAIILTPLFFRGAGILIGFLLFPMLISIHAFRARRKLGAVIASILLPLIVFIDSIALYYVAYACSSPSEIQKITEALGVSPAIAYLVLAGIALMAGVSLYHSIYSFIVLYKNIDSLV